MSRRWTTRRAVLAHVAIAIWCPGCLIAGWWQVHVALSGDDLGYLYSVEWPIFALFGLVVWWNAIHDDPERVGARALARLRRSRADSGKVASPANDVIARRPETEDAELAAYNDYLAELASREKPKSWLRS